MLTNSWRDQADTDAAKVVPVNSADGGKFDAYMAIPKIPNGCGIVVLQEIFGITRNIRGYCDLFARNGFLAAAPDLFWRMEPGAELARDKEGVAKAFDFLHRFDEPKGLEDCKATIAYLRCRGMRKVGVVGYCLGGKLVSRLASQGASDCAVSFYGVGIEQNLDELRGLTRPLQMHFGGKDDHVSPAAIESIREATSRAPVVETHIYPEAGHAFFSPDLEGADSETAWKRTLSFLQKNLQ